ncbi:hypothetical protein [Cohnella abietis]|uniref:Uncharacterized protein n=1 Tax=Cohnella abietis TaxID=2507935 RepID=A0A3T1D315_9BACL|nr:hypothetical protein [Cohnella abietis]BBI32497.1 hypothetical protein KCTCHS21_18960 [Cohnella abietis]
MDIGRRIYYELATGNVIQDTGERSGSVIETTNEQDFETYVSLAERIPETVGCLQLEYGEYAQDFAECNGYRVDVSNDIHSLLFSHPDPNEPELPPIYRKPLSGEVAEVKEQQALMQAALDDLILGGGL